MVHDYDLRDPDMMELMLGGMRYENVPLPDSMMDTTVFVGNLCEFAKDEDLSGIFRSVTNLQSLPACVARRPNYQSLQYGFVAFPTVEEKEVSILLEYSTVQYCNVVSVGTTRLLPVIYTCTQSDAFFLNIAISFFC